MAAKQHPTRRRGKRQFGFGRSINYAFKQALIRIYGKGNNFLTIHTHLARFKLFTKWLKDFDGTTDARLISNKHLIDYAKYLKGQNLEISYAVNRLSTVNTAMHAFRGDKEIWISPSKYLGMRQYNCESAAEGDWQQISALCNLLISKNNQRAAAVVRLARAFGMEASRSLPC